MKEQESLIIERIYDAPVEKVWKALTEIEQMKQWYFPMLKNFEPKVGFKTEFIVHHNNNDYPHIWNVTEAVPMKKIAYHWRYGGYPGDSIVSFELEPDGDKTKLTFTHLFLESFEPEKYPDMSRDSFNKGWTHFTAALKSYVEK